jgi:hypothetical protein
MRYECRRGRVTCRLGLGSEHLYRMLLEDHHLERLTGTRTGGDQHSQGMM